MDAQRGGANPGPQSGNNQLTIISLSASQGPYNTSVTITGTGFDPNSSNDEVFFNGKAATITAATSTQLVSNVPVGAGTGAVTVAVGGKTATGPVFTYQLTETVSTFAGNMDFGGGLVDGKGTSAKFSQPTGLAIDLSGNLYVADKRNNCIRKITPDGSVSTFAGNGVAGHDDGLGTKATFSLPVSVAVDVAGNVYVLDGYLIRQITPAGQVSTIAQIIVGSVYPSGIAVDAADNVYVADNGNHTIKKITPAGVISTFAGSDNNPGHTDGKGTAASFFYPIGITIDKSGNFYVTEADKSDIRKITSDGVVSTLTGMTNGYKDGSLSDAWFNLPEGITADNTGNIYVADTNNNMIRFINSVGIVSTLAGNLNIGITADGPVKTAGFVSPIGVVVDNSGNVYTASYVENQIKKISMQ